MVICLLGPYLGIFAYLKFEQRIIKKEIKHKLIKGIDKEDLVKLVFTESDLINKVSWEHSKEFEYNGEMYDVVASEQEGDKFVYWCWWDHKETSLNKKLNQLLANFLGESNPDKSQSNTLSGFLKSVYIVPTEINIEDIVSVEKERPNIPLFFISGSLKKPNLPPPQILNIA